MVGFSIIYFVKAMIMERDVTECASYDIFIISFNDRDKSYNQVFYVFHYI